MSFGFSIGDFAAALQLANKIRKEFVGAPSQFKSISDEVRSLSIVLEDVDINLSGCEISNEQQSHLESISTNCRNVLVDLENTVAKYQELEYSGESLTRKLRRGWKRLQWEPDDVRELRGRVTANIALLNTFLAALSSQVAFDTKRGVDQLNQHQDHQDRLAVLDWLTPTDYAPQQSDYIHRRQEGTGQWLLDSTEFNRWVEHSRQTLFCPGIPGAGKTILTSLVIEYLYKQFSQQTDDVGIAYVYCNFKRRDDQTSANLLASLLKQLSQAKPSLPDQTRALYEHHKEKRTRPSLEEISQTLQSVANMYSRVFVIVDAVDECPTLDGGRTELLAQMFQLQSHSRINLFATSRPIPEITEWFTGSVWLEIRASEQDVQRYIDGHLSILPGFIRRNIDIQKEISTAILQSVQGMFLLAQLHLQSLVGKISIKAVRAALAKLPTGSDAYDRVYQDTMERIEGQLKDEEELAKQVLMWITLAKRPLTTTELQHALGVEVGEDELDEENLPQIEDMVSVCAGLVTVDAQSNIIRLVHYTTQEYFDRSRDHWFPDAGVEITTVCTTYLSFKSFESGPCDSYAEFKERLNMYPLYNYAACHWGHHAPKGWTSSKALDFLSCHVKLTASSQAFPAVVRSNRDGYSQRYRKGLTSLHVAAHFGLDGVVPTLLRQNIDVNAKDSVGETPLFCAAKRGQEVSAKLLLEHGAYANPKNDWHITPLLCAARYGYEAIVDLLCEHGADVDAKDSNGLTPLLRAAKLGRQATTKVLLEYGANPNSRDSYGMTPLSWAAENGHQDIVKLLLDNDKVNPNLTDHIKRNPLSFAAGWGHTSIAIALLGDKRVDIDLRDHYGSTALSIAARNGSGEIVKLLLGTAGVDIDSRDCLGRSSLWFARRYGETDIAQLILDTAKKRNVVLVEENMPLEKVATVSDEEGVGWCDVCTMDLHKGAVFFSCKACNAGDFDVCSECHKLGGRCLELDHELVERRV